MNVRLTMSPLDVHLDRITVGSSWLVIVGCRLHLRGVAAAGRWKSLIVRLPEVGLAEICTQLSGFRIGTAHVEVAAYGSGAVECQTIDLQCEEPLVSVGGRELRGSFEGGSCLLALPELSQDCALGRVHQVVAVEV